MPRLHRPGAVRVTAGLPARQRNHDRAAKVARDLTRLARRGPEMATAVETALSGLGNAQLRSVIVQLWETLARKGGDHVE